MANRSGDCPIQVSRKAGVVVVELQDRYITSDEWVALLEATFRKIIDKEAAPKVLVLLSEVEHISSAVLGEFISVNRQLRRKDGELRLAGVRPEVAEIFAITRLDQSFRIHATPDEALKAFA